MVPKLALKHHVLSAVNVIVWQVSEAKYKVPHLHVYRIEHLGVLLCTVEEPVDKPNRHKDNDEVYNEHEVDER